MLYVNLIRPAGQLARVPAGGRGPQGQRPGTYAPSSAFNEINRKIALELQADVVQKMQQRFVSKRRAAQTNRLVRTTASSRNLRADANYFGVGVIDYLENSEAKYWRTIEEGSLNVWRKPFIGTQLFPRGRPGFPVARYDTPGLRTSEYSSDWMDGSRYVVKREIAPQWSYRDAHADIQPGRRAQVDITNYLRSISMLRLLSQEDRADGVTKFRPNRSLL